MAKCRCGDDVEVLCGCVRLRPLRTMLWYDFGGLPAIALPIALVLEGRRRVFPEDLEEAAEMLAEKWQNISQNMPNWEHKRNISVILSYLLITGRKGDEII